MAHWQDSPPKTLALIKEILAANRQPIFKYTDEEMAAIKKAAHQLDFVGVNNYFSKWLRAYHGKSETITIMVMAQRDRQLPPSRYRRGEEASRD